MMSSDRRIVSEYYFGMRESREQTLDALVQYGSANTLAEAEAIFDAVLKKRVAEAGYRAKRRGFKTKPHHQPIPTPTRNP